MKKIFLLAIILISFSVNADFLSEKWNTDLLEHGAKTDYTTNVPPVAYDIDNDGFHEIFVSIGYDHDYPEGVGDEGIVYCLDGSDGDVIWSEYSDNFGSHTCMELYDLDSDGDMELLATGYHHVVAFHAENGDILWDFTRPDNRQDKPSVMIEEDGEVYVFTVSHQGSNGIGLQKRFGRNGSLVKEVAGPLHPCHGGLSADDLDGDGAYELIVTDRDYGTGHRGLHAYDTDLNLLWSHPTIQCSSHLANIIDVNADGVLDVIAMDQGDGSAGICVVDGSDGEKMPGKCVENLGLYAHYTPAIYDIDSDGNLELITARSISGGPPTSVWDLTDWELDGEYWRDASEPWGLSKPPQIANVLYDEGMEMVFITHGGFHVFGNCTDPGPGQEISCDRTDQYTGYAGRADRMLVQDIDEDGKNEIIAVMHGSGSGSYTYAMIQCLDTTGDAPTPNARTESFLYSFRRNPVSVYVEPFEEEPPENQAPVLENIGDKSVTEGQVLQFTVSASDPEEDSLFYSASNMPTGASFTSQQFTWTPSQPGTYSNVCFAVNDSELEDSECIDITVQSSGGSSGRIQKMSICYGNACTLSQQSTREFIAQNFDLLDCGKSISSDAQQVKNLNPNIKIIGYYDSMLMQPYYSDWEHVNQQEDWFVHDKEDNRIINPTYGAYLMDLDSGWSDYYAQQSQQFLQDNPHYDGIFADDCPADLQEAGYSWSVSYDDFEDGVLDTWNQSMKAHLNNLQSTIGNKMVMPNSWKYTHFCEEVANVHFYEGFIHGRSHAYDDPGYGCCSGYNYGLNAINWLNEQAKLGNTIAVNSGCKNADEHPDEAKEWMKFTLAALLFAAEDLEKTYYSWHFYGQESSNGYYPEMDYQHGQPMGDYYLLQDLVYAREFENSFVVANFDTENTSSFELDGKAYDLEPRHALFIEKTTSCNPCELSAPSLSPSEPEKEQDFNITCTSNSNYDCIDAYVDSDSCNLSSWSGNKTIFTCQGVQEGIHTAKCEAVPVTEQNCCYEQKTKEFTIASEEDNGDNNGNGNNGGNTGGEPITIDENETEEENSTETPQNQTKIENKTEQNETRPKPGPICGNGIKEEGEECDGTAPEGYECNWCILEEKTEKPEEINSGSMDTNTIFVALAAIAGITMILLTGLYYLRSKKKPKVSLPPPPK